MSRISTFLKTRTGKVALGGTVALILAGVPASQAVFSSSDTTSAYAQTGKVELVVTEKIAVGNVLPGVPRTAPIEFDNSASTAPVSMALSAVSPVNRNNPGGSDLDLLTVKLLDKNGNTVVNPTPFDELRPADLGITIPEGAKWQGTVVWELPVDAGNEYQKVAVHYASLTFTGTQVVPSS